MKPIAATIEFTEELSKVLSHGAPLGKALDIISGDLSDKNLRRFFLTGNFEEVNTEKFLLMIKAKPEYFPDEIINLYSRALKGPNPPDALNKMIKYMELRNEFLNRKDNIYYSIGILGLLFLIMSRLFYNAFDSFSKVLYELDYDFPLPTQLSITLTKMLGDINYSVFLFLILAAAVYMYLLKREVLIKLFFGIPILNSLIMAQYSIYSYNCLINLIKMGYSPNEALRELKKQKEMLIFSDYFSQLNDTSGSSTKKKFQKKKLQLFSNKVISELKEKKVSNFLETLLPEEAENLWKANENFRERLTLFLKPLAMITITFIIVIMVVSLFLPLYLPVGSIGM